MVNLAACAAALRVLRFLETHGASVTWNGAGVVVSPPHREADGVIEALQRAVASGRGRPVHARPGVGSPPAARASRQGRCVRLTLPTRNGGPRSRGCRSSFFPATPTRLCGLGWSEDELFSVPSHWPNVSQTGAGLLINDREVISITPTEIRIKTSSGSSLAFYRKPEVDYGLVFRERLKLIRRRRLQGRVSAAGDRAHGQRLPRQRRRGSRAGEKDRAGRHRGRCAMNLVTRWGALPNTRIDGLLAEGCKQCDRLGVAHTLARLVRWRVGTDAAGMPIDQVRLVCCHCHARLGTALKMADHPNWREYPEYDAAYAKLTDAVASVSFGDVDAARKLCRKSPSLLLEEVAEIMRGGPAAEAFRPRRMSVGGDRAGDCARR